MTTSIINALTPKNAQVSLTTSSLEGIFESFLTNYYFQQGKTLQIDDATLTQDEDGISVTGTSSFLNLPSLPTTLELFEDEAGGIQMIVTYDIITLKQSSSYWSFSRSFAKLPLQMDNTILLDRLRYTQAAFVVSSYAHEIEGIGFVEGINFIGQAKPTGHLGIIEHTFNSSTPLNVHGFIKIPKNATQAAIPTLARGVSSAQAYPWNFAAELSGIFLEADLTTEFAIGSAKLTSSTYRLYSPIDDTPKNNALFKPLQAISATLNISDSLSIDAIIKQPSENVLFFETQFEGFSIANLAQLADLSGGNLLDDLPNEIQDILSSLSQLELMDLAFSMQKSSTSIALKWFTCQIGIKELNWDIIGKDGEYLSLNSLGCRFEVSDPLSTTPKVTVSLWGKGVLGGVDIAIKGSLSFVRGSMGEMTLVAMLEEGETLPLANWFEPLMPSDAIQAPSNLAIDDMFVSMSMQKSPRAINTQFSAKLATSPAWMLDIGLTKATFSNIKIDFQRQYNAATNRYDTSGVFRGDLQIGDSLSFATKYAKPGDFVLKGSCDELKLTPLLKALSDQGIANTLDVTLRNATAQVSVGDKGLVFQMGTEVEDIGILALEAKRVNQKWGVAVGMSLSSPRISSIKGLGALKPIEDTVELQDLLIVMSSYEGAEFKFPDIATFSPTLSSHTVQLPAQASGLIQGMNIYGKWHLDNDNKEQKLLRQILGLEPNLAITLQLGSNPKKESRLFVAYDTKIDKKWPLSCQFGVALKGGKAEFFLLGTALFKINKKNYQADLALSFVSGGAFLSGSLKGTIKISSLQLSNLALVAGFNWSGIPSLGIAGSIDIDSFSSSIALFFDSTDPSRTIIAGAISDIALDEVIESIAGVKNLPKEIDGIFDKIKIEGTSSFYLPANLAQALDNQELSTIASVFSQYGKISIPSQHEKLLLVVKSKGKAWQITDMQNAMRHYQLQKVGNQIKVSLQTQLYCVPQSSQIGALEFPAGFFLNGTLSLFGLKATTKVEVNASKGIAADAYLNKALSIGGGQFFKLSDAEGKKGPRLSLSSYTQNNHPTKEFRKPHCYLDGKIMLLGLNSTGLVSVTTKGLHFYIKNVSNLKSPGSSIAGGKVKLTYAIEGEVGSASALSAGGELGVQIQGNINFAKIGGIDKALDKALGFDVPMQYIKELGSLKINIQADGTVATSYNGKKASATFNGSFVFNNKRTKFKKRLNTKKASLANISSLVLEEIEKVLVDNLKMIDNWSDWMAKGLLSGVKDVKQAAKVMKNVYKKSAGETAKLLKKSGKTAKEIGDALSQGFGADPEDAIKALKGIGVDADDVAKVLKGSFKLSTKDSGKYLKDVYNLGEKDLKKALKGAGFATKEIDKFTKSAFKSVGKTAKKVGKKVKKFFK